MATIVQGRQNSVGTGGAGKSTVGPQTVTIQLARGIALRMVAKLMTVLKITVNGILYNQLNVQRNRPVLTLQSGLYIKSRLLPILVEF